MAAARDPGPRPIRVLTWNIRAGIGPGEPFPPAWWRHVRRDRLERIAALIHDLDPDVVTLQEVTMMNVDGVIVDQPADLAVLTGLRARYGAVHSFTLVEPETGRSIGTASWGNAILSRNELIDGFTTGLPRAGDDDLLAPPGSAERLAAVRYGDADPGHRERRCAVGGRLGADGPMVVTAHLTYIGREQRRMQAEALAGIVRDARGPAALTGDFNAGLDADELASLGGFVDAFAAVGVPIGDPARASCGPLALDHILVRGLSVETCRLISEAGELSDHLPVLATMALPSA